MIGLKRVVTMLAAVLAASFACGCAGAGPVDSQQAESVMTKLRFMAGTWTCAIRAGQGAGYVDRSTYRFVAGGTWMEEYSDPGPRHADMSSVQMWGYDGSRKNLVAYQFMGAGVATKLIDGWQNGSFISHRDDNGATVSIQPRNARAFDWVIVSKDQSNTVREECTR